MAEDSKFNEAHYNRIAKDLIDQLPDHIGEQVELLANEYKVPLWQFVCGIMLDSYQLGRLSAFVLDPAWKDGYRHRDYKCAHCGKAFEAIRINQVYCSNECGTEAAKEARVNGSLNDAKAQPITNRPPVDRDSDGDSAPTEDDVLAALDSFAASGGAQTNESPKGAGDWTTKLRKGSNTVQSEL